MSTIVSAASRRARRPRYLSTAFGILVVVIMLFPVYWMVNASLQRGGSAIGSTLIPINLSWSGYEAALREQGQNLVTSIIVSAGTVAFTLLISVPAAYILAKFVRRGTSIFILALLVAQMVPGIVLANALYSVYSSLGILNSIPGLILADASRCIPFSIILLRAFMLALPSELLEAARIDGASHFRAFRSIALPLSQNAIITAGLFSFLFTWGDFIFAVTLTTTADVRPITLGIYNYLAAQQQEWGPVMATSVIAALPAMIILMAAQRYITAGSLSGALK
ncbi:MAG TPA: carbohydrate ABC transporter permease [Pseudolysinimonas sp.]|jgi:multiple sugar transport system permease protein|nr:carbohydrate ABC transporter permease [Pseudolysinimonas sp.]